MYRIVWAFLLAVPLASAAGPVGAREPGRLADALALQDAMAAAIQRAEPAVACILVTRSEDRSEQAALAQPGHVPESYGSGVVIDESGLLLTNLHVVRDATAVYVRLPGDRAGYADIYAGDPRSDLAVLRLQKPETFRPLVALKLGDGGKVRKGDIVLLVANPFAAGFRDGSPSASWGIISNLRRRAPSRPGALEEANYNRTLHEYGTLIQTDARLNLGCSGGALIDLKGDLIGLTTSLAAIYGGETPGGFAVPMDDGMRRIIEVLKRGEEVEYGFLGVSAQQARSGDGVVIDHVIPGSPAYLRLHGVNETSGPDVIRRVNGVVVQDRDDLFLALGTLLAGSEARLEVAHRGGRVEVITVKLAKFYVSGKVIVTRRPPAVGGLRVDWTSVLFLRPGAQHLFGRGIPKGVMIREVQTGSAADAARLQESKVIQFVNGHPVNNPDDFYREMRNAAGPVELTLWGPLGGDTVKIDLK
jgi:S1-C subfamily serine protease